MKQVSDTYFGSFPFFLKPLLILQVEIGSLGLGSDGMVSHKAPFLKVYSFDVCTYEA